ncbi:DUF3718 domain-containing protein [Psychrobium sp. 1_MG-2023]|uniref:DUF3718 domain-containing protein n=1 Tax=Psychrobium sp. 1_MG-2023 TaxID=3062624 RepID=UPI000C33A2F9|nr:DUF3718 domain-containing protein [Psychrobium sp. 1_MG-2023]MDP2561948.1 DUF3718 domain-containing protein [Psychrobium sp. 1_MG-2023]PKF58670.1 hypothetical protein CW748_03275 [Alteromonadales bacterium alter-6D02]
MGILKLAIITSLTLSSMAVTATTYKFIPGNNEVGTKLCVEAGSNDLKGYRSEMRSHRLNNRRIANNLTCNGENVASFAERYNALKTAAHINKFRKNRVTITDLAANKSPQTSDTEVIIVTVN